MCRAVVAKDMGIHVGELSSYIHVNYRHGSILPSELKTLSGTYILYTHVNYRHDWILLSELKT